MDRRTSTSGRERRLRRAALAAAMLLASAAARSDASPADSPRAALASYLDLCRAGRFDEAARHMDLPADREADGAELARKLKAVLDRHAWFDLEAVSDQPQGDDRDALPAGVDEIATIHGPLGPLGGALGVAEPVRLVRQADGRWLFARSVVGRVEPWYDALPDRRLRELLPEPLFRPGPRELLWWQWIALPLLLGVAWLAGRVLGFCTRHLLQRVAARTPSTLDDRLLPVLASPITALWTLGLAIGALPALELYQPAHDFIQGLLRGAALVTLFWGAARAIDVAARSLSAGLAGQSVAAGLVPLGVRVAKVGVAAIAVVTLLSALGYPVASLVAGLGLGGLAFALAAQKTVENLFGSLSIALDQPIKEGDFVRVDGDLGTVEAIGLRSTRIRTLDRTVVTLPNARLADMRLESFTARDRMRLACVVALEHGTTSAQLREVLGGMEAVLRRQPKLWTNDLVVRLKEIGGTSLDVEIQAWFLTGDGNEFLAIRQDVLLGFMDVVERAGARFAIPPRSVRLLRDDVGRARGASSGSPDAA